MFFVQAINDILKRFDVYLSVKWKKRRTLDGAFPFVIHCPKYVLRKCKWVNMHVAHMYVCIYQGNKNYIFICISMTLAILQQPVLPIPIFSFAIWPFFKVRVFTFEAKK